MTKSTPTPLPKLSMGLTTGGFDEILENGSGIDFRLNARRWDILENGDVFEFLEDPGEKRKYSVRIIKKYFAKDFAELIDSLPTEIYDKARKEKTLDFLSKWWTPEDESKDGVLALHVELVPNSYKN